LAQDLSSPSLFEYLNPEAFPESGSPSTKGEVNLHIFAALRMLLRGRWEGAEKELDLAIDRQDRSQRFRRLVFALTPGEKEVFTFAEGIQSLFATYTGARLIVKWYREPAKVVWLDAYWRELAAARGEHPGLPGGEIVAHTPHYLLSLQFQGENLCYEARAGRHHDALIGLNGHLIPFTRRFVENRRLPVRAEAYAGKFKESAGKLSALLPWSARRRLLTAIGTLDDKVFTGGQELVPFTDLKSANVLLDPATRYRVIDADKMDCEVTYAHNLAHILYDPRWNLGLEERRELAEREGLFSQGRRNSTVACFAYYLVRQTSLLLPGSKTPFPAWRMIDRGRLESFYAEMLTLLNDCRDLPPAFAALADLPPEPPAWH
jgi:hypothetical protein